MLKCLVLLAVLLLPLAGACGGDSGSDRVVDVVLRCTQPARRGEPAIEWQGDRECWGSRLEDYYNPRFEVTVRSSKGGSYVVSVPTTTAVEVGDRWVAR